MANDKDFILKNAVEVSGPTKTTVGTISSSDLDLATGNYFSDTLAANTTYTISNAGDVQAFQLEVTGGNIPFETSGIEQLSGTLSVAGQETSSQGMFIGDGGTKLYITGTAGDDVNQYSLSTAWDISTATFTKSQSTSAQDSAMRSLWFKPDGTKMFMVGTTNDRVYEYSLSTAWDVGTESYGSDFLSVGAQDGNMYGMCFDTTGTRMYLGGVSNKRIYQYSLSTAWDITTASYDSSYYQLDTGVGIGDIAISSDGTKFAVLDYSNGKLLLFSFGTAYSISTLSSSSDYAFSDSVRQSFFAKPDGTKFYLELGTSDVFYQFSFEGAATITWPSSIEWPGGVAPSAPANGETDLYTFVTDDSGTSYIGLKSADNLS